ncbi:MAG: DNA gyrase inhibitor YacG [Nitrosospira sp.]
MKQPIVNCPNCGKIMVWDTGNRYRPFCSERCKMIDLGQWASESYRIPDAETDTEAEKQEEDVSKDEQ